MRVKKIAAILMAILAITMFYLAYKIGGIPPAITGIGFLVVAWVFIKDAGG